MRLRKAVGAIVFNDKNEILLVKKVKIGSGQQKINVTPSWDIIKGGVLKEDQTLNEAILRELFEETGSNDYQIELRYTETIDIEFSDDVKKVINYDRQKTYMFLVRFLGKLNQLKPQDDEIETMMFLSINKSLTLIKYPETKKFILENYELVD